MKSKKNIKVFFVLFISVALLMAIFFSANAYQKRPTAKESSQVYSDTYTAYVDDVFAGNKYLVDVKVGFGIELNNLPVQLNNICTPELKTQDGDKAKHFAESQILDRNVLMRVYQQSDSGRWLVDILYDNKNLSDQIITKGYGNQCA